MPRLKENYSHSLKLIKEMNSVENYMESVDKILKETTDPFAKQYSDLLKSIIRIFAMENWISNGEPILSTEQMIEVYEKAKNQSGDKAWAIVGSFNICMN